MRAGAEIMAHDPSEKCEAGNVSDFIREYVKRFHVRKYEILGMSYKLR